MGKRRKTWKREMKTGKKTGTETGMGTRESPAVSRLGNRNAENAVVCFVSLRKRV
jgi:hypothetical protein